MKRPKNDTIDYVADYKAGMSVEDIAEKRGVTPASVTVGLKKHGENPSRRAKKVTEFDRNEVINALNTGPRLYDAAVKLGVSLPTLNKIISEMKIEREVKYS